MVKERWDNAKGYEAYVGRWSRLLSSDFIEWLHPNPGQTWLEIGCGTGALTKVILEKCSPSSIVAMDKSGAYISEAKETISSDNVSFLETDADSYSSLDEFNNITSGLVLNFLPDVKKSLTSILKNLKVGGQMSAFVWDYSGHYQPMRLFWDAAREIIPAAQKFDAAVKFELCKKDNLIRLFESIGLSQIEFTNLERIATFKNFDDYWLPISNSQGSVTEFYSTLDENQKKKLRATIQGKLPSTCKEEIKLIINALAVKGLKN